MNEAIETLKKYFSEESNTIHFHGDNSFVTHFAEVLFEGISREYEAPDLYIKYGNELWIIEHFEFDCFKSSRKGSTYKREQSRINKIEENIKPTKEGVVFHNTIDANSSYNDYVNNVAKIFNSHYQKIEKYKSNLINDKVADENTRFITLFLIDDVSPLGSSYVDEQGKWRAIILAHSKEFLNLLRESPLLNGVLAVSCCSKEKFIWFIDGKQIDEYYLNAEDYSNCKFMNFKPHIVGFKIEL